MTAARAIFTAQQKIDPLCMLGLFQLEDKAGHAREAAAIGAEIISTPYKGVLGAILYQATKGRGIKPARPPEDMAALATLLAKFPVDWLNVVRLPFRYYALRVEPVKVGHRLGEPFLAKMTIENMSLMDITIGDAGLIKPIVCFDAEIRGIGGRKFPAIAVDRIMDRFVLRHGEVITQIIRIDQGVLGDYLRSKPDIMLLVNGEVVTNADPSQPFIKAHAGGYAHNFGKMLMRKDAPLAQNAQRRKFFAALAGGGPGEKMLDVELLASNYSGLMQPNANAAQKAFAQQFLDVIAKEMDPKVEPIPGVRIWASYWYALLATGDVAQKAVSDMMDSASWEMQNAGAGRFQQPPAARNRQTASGKGGGKGFRPDREDVCRGAQWSLSENYGASPRNPRRLISCIAPIALSPPPGHLPLRSEPAPPEFFKPEQTPSQSSTRPGSP